MPRQPASTLLFQPSSFHTSFSPANDLLPTLTIPNPSRKTNNNLTNETIRRCNWEQYGHPDRRQVSMGIAILDIPSRAQTDTTSWHSTELSLVVYYLEWLAVGGLGPGRKRKTVSTQSPLLFSSRDSRM
ncbi:hypothetical protein D9758_015832 [Tetrapyrgos nigripes]|uniref:Uncharacterized protein n=1 Tax=Tetrapyrgos nigripes TaxID=182062 RepID=A0A8H5FKV3_9AGAR|nr:hypothetical protein D9758_015832 [Tetrapyrgos nigripes]